MDDDALSCLFFGRARSPPRLVRGGARATRSPAATVRGGMRSTPQSTDGVVSSILLLPLVAHFLVLFRGVCLLQPSPTACLSDCLAVLSAVFIRARRSSWHARTTSHLWRPNGIGKDGTAGTMKLPFAVNHGHHRAPACVSRAGEPSGAGLDVARTSALQHVLAAALSMAVLSSPLSPAVAATDGAAIGKCLLANCQIPLAKCITNPTCLTNLACIQTCTNRCAPACRSTVFLAVAARSAQGFGPGLLYARLRRRRPTAVRACALVLTLALALALALTLTLTLTPTLTLALALALALTLTLAQPLTGPTRPSVRSSAATSSPTTWSAISPSAP